MSNFHRYQSFFICSRLIRKRAYYSIHFPVKCVYTFSGREIDKSFYCLDLKCSAHKSIYIFFIKFLMYQIPRSNLCPCWWLLYVGVRGRLKCSGYLSLLPAVSQCLLLQVSWNFTPMKQGKYKKAKVYKFPITKILIVQHAVQSYMF